VKGAQRFFSRTDWRMFLEIDKNNSERKSMRLQNFEGLKDTEAES